MKPALIIAFGATLLLGCSKKPGVAVGTSAREAQPPQVKTQEIQVESIGAPFLVQVGKTESKPLAVILESKEVSVPVVIYYSLEGRVLRVESVSKDTETFRMTTEMVKERMAGRGQVEAVTSTSSVGEFHYAWKNISARYDLSKAREFSLTSVRHRFLNDVADGVYILEVRGLANPLNIPHQAPPKFLDKGRIYFNREGQQIASDNIL